MAEKPPYFSDEEWAEHQREDRVVQFDQSRKRKRKPLPPLGERPAWFDALRTDERGRVFPDLANALIAFRAEPGYAFALAFDEMAQAGKLTRQPPLAKGAEPGQPPPRLLDPEDVTRAQEWLQTMGLPRIGRENVEHAVELIARERPFHPLRDWLNGLEWDGEPRIGSWLHRYLGTPEDEYHRQIGSMFLIAMVARVFDPGCQADYMLVLEGPQGEEKSKLCRALAGDEYYSDSLPSLGGGDAVRVSAHLKGKWLLEVSDLSAFSRADIEVLKAFITRRVEIYIPKYGRLERREPRQCLFVATTNDDSYIKDDTGARRFWPVVVAAIDLAGFAAARDQLFAEAVAAYRDGKPHWPDREFEKTVIAPIQEDRQFEDAWTQKVLKIIELQTSTTLMEIGEALGFETARFDMFAQKRVASILRKEKWKKGRNHANQKVWRKP